MSKRKTPSREKPIPVPLRRTLDATELAARTMLSPKQAAILCGFSQRHLYNCWYEGRGPAYVRIGARRLIRRVALEKWAAEQEAATMAAAAKSKRPAHA